MCTGVLEAIQVILANFPLFDIILHFISDEVQHAGNGKNENRLGPCQD